MNIKNLLIGNLLLALLLLSMLSKAQNTVLSGNLKGLAGDQVHIFYNKDDASHTDTIKAVNDNFTWKANLKEPLLLALSTGKEYFFFFVAPGRIHLSGVNNQLKTYVVSGSPVQRDADAFKVFIKDLANQRDTLNARFKDATPAQKATIAEQRKLLSKRWEERTAQFIAAHPASLYSVYLISIERDYQETKRLFNRLNASAKKSFGGQKIARLLESQAKGQIGVMMMGFTLPDTSGRPVKLTGFKKKYILIDFWASWCMPCRAENPNVLKAYQAFKDAGFTVIGISLDNDGKNWKKAIREDQLPWTQLSDLKGWKSDLAGALGIQAIPSNFLINASGEIVAKDLREEALENKLKELLN